jgi:U3 small nucleolar RNA-associated protein 10
MLHTSDDSPPCRACLLQPLFQILSKLRSDQWVSGIDCQYTNQHDASSETPDLSSSVKESQHLILLVLKDITDTLHSSYQVLCYADFQLLTPVIL